MNRQQWIVIGGIAVMALLLVACGGGAAPTTAPAAAPTTAPAAAPTPVPIKAPFWVLFIGSAQPANAIASMAAKIAFLLIISPVVAEIYQNIAWEYNMHRTGMQLNATVRPVAEDLLLGSAMVKADRGAGR